MKLTARQLLQKAQEEGWALGAFNAANVETLKAIVQAAGKLRAPVIIESSPGETKFFGPENLVSVVKNFREEYNLPVLINLDHAEDERDVERAIEAGYELVHFDGSKVLPLDDNIEITRRLVKKAHEKSLLVEAEIDHIGGSSAPHLEENVESAQKSANYTDPEKATRFIEKTGVDIFAAFFGNVHGVYKTPPKLDIGRLKKIKEKVSCFLSMHGGSGIPDSQVKEAIKVGRIVKINVNTDLRVAYRKALEKALKDSKEVAIYKIMPPVIEAVQRVVEQKICLFGSKGKADFRH